MHEPKLVSVATAWKTSTLKTQMPWFWPAMARRSSEIISSIWRSVLTQPPLSTFPRRSAPMRTTLPYGATLPPHRHKLCFSQSSVLFLLPWHSLRVFTLPIPWHTPLQKSSLKVLCHYSLPKICWNKQLNKIESFKKNQWSELRKLGQWVKVPAMWAQWPKFNLWNPCKGGKLEPTKFFSDLYIHKAMASALEHTHPSHRHASKVQRIGSDWALPRKGCRQPVCRWDLDKVEKIVKNKITLVKEYGAPERGKCQFLETLPLPTLGPHEC